MLQVDIRQQFRRDQFPSLMPSLSERCAEVHVENMQQRAVHRQVRAQTAALLASAHAEIVIARAANRQAAEHYIAVRVPEMPAVLADLERHSDLRRERLRLVPH